jgi:hypothetical protein
MRRVLRDNALSLTLFGLFLIFLAGQSVAGHRASNNDNQEQASHRSPTSST